MDDLFKRYRKSLAKYRIRNIWQRCTKQAAFASIVVAEIFLVALTFGFLPQSLTFGFLPGLPAMAIGLILLFVVSYLTPSEKGVGGTKIYFDVFDGPAGLD